MLSSQLVSNFIRKEIIQLKSLFPERGRWFKGMLHSHTTDSDGWLSPRNVLRAYKAMGFDFVCLTDHWKVTPAPKDAPDGLLCIPGVELDGGKTDVGDCHIVGIDVHKDAFFERPPKDVHYSVQKMVDLIRSKNGLAMLAHPSWDGVTWLDVKDVADKLFALEVWNSGCDVEIGRGLADVQWDDLLSRGYKIKGIAVDDAHRYFSDAGKGWVMVKASSLTHASIRAALEKGAFYSSCSPLIHELKRDKKSFYIRTSPVRKIDMVSSPTHGSTFSVFEGCELTEHTFKLPKAKVRYVRFRVTDSGGRQAWTNSIIFP